MAVAVIAETPPSALPLDTVLHGDCLDVLRGLPDNSVDAIVTDPPAGISFMGKGWDSNKGGRAHWVAAFTAIYRECLRVLKPGGHALVWALPRTSHWTATALEDAGFDVRDRLAHVFGSGFPKSLDVSKAIDKAAGATRQKTKPVAVPARNRNGTNALGGSWQDDPWETAPATDAARSWDGWGTALKPAVEDWWLVRKPLAEGTVAANVLRWGTGALNIEASRVATDEVTARTPSLVRNTAAPFGKGYTMGGRGSTAGRFPANLLLSHSIWCSDGGCTEDCPVAALDAMSGVTPRGGKPQTRKRNDTAVNIGIRTRLEYNPYPDTMRGDSGASRYFTTFRYQPKASRAERNRGLDAMPAKPSARYGRMAGTPEHGAKHDTPEANTHPCVKPQSLMTWLITLITPPGGIVLDPFAGSGSTLVAAKMGGWRFIGVEREPEYVAIAQARLAAVRPLLKG